MDRAALTATVFDVIRSHAAGFAGDLRLDTPLGPDGVGIDSIACLGIVLELERRTGIQVRDESLTAEALATPGSLVAYLEQSGGG